MSVESPLEPLRRLLAVHDLVDDARKVAREYGYAVGLHGTLKRDIDLIAAPWVPEAASADELIEALSERLNLIANPGPLAPPKPIAHGRRGWILYPREWHGPRPPHIDISVMPLRRRKARTS